MRTMYDYDSRNVDFKRCGKRPTQMHMGITKTDLVQNRLARVAIVHCVAFHDICV